MSIAYSDNPNSKALTTKIILPISSSPELLLIGYELKITIVSIDHFFSLILVLLNLNKYRQTMI